MADTVQRDRSRNSVQQTVRSLRRMPVSRWLLFAGSLGALLIPFLPWFTAQQCPPYEFCGPTGPYLTYTYNPLEFYLRIITVRLHVQSFEPALLSASVVPGMLCSVWVHGRIQTWGQRIGIVAFTIWFLALIGLNSYATYWFFTAYFNRYPIAVSLAPTIGAYLLVLACLLLWFGLLLLWRELLRSHRTPLHSDIQQQTPWAYTGAVLTTAGLLVWFIGYYGIYWLLPPGCFARLFGEAPCNNRFSAQIGFNSLFPHYTFQYAATFVYWTLAALVVFGGLALLVVLWLRPTTSVDLPWITTWGACLAMLTGGSFIGMLRLPANYAGDHWTNGPLVTLAGLALLAAGALLRWRSEATILHRTGQSLPTGREGPPHANRQRTS